MLIAVGTYRLNPSMPCETATFVKDAEATGALDHSRIGQLRQNIERSQQQVLFVMSYSTMSLKESAMAHLLDVLTRSRVPSEMHDSFDWQTFVTLLQEPAVVRMRSPFAQGSWTPLHCTGFRGKAQYSALLLARGADPNAVDASLSQTPLHVCISMARWQPVAAVETAEVLLKYGADVNASMTSGKNALIEAVSGGCEEMVKLLLAGGADLNATVRYGSNGDRHTALYLALYINKEKMVRMLLEAGATFDTDVSQPTIQTLASAFEYVRIIIQGDCESDGDDREPVRPHTSETDL